MNPFFSAWAATDKLTFLRYQKIKKYFGNLESAWKNADKQSLKEAGLQNKTIEKILELIQKINPNQEFEKIQKLKIQLIDFESEEYPILLKEISAPPVFLYIKGQLNPKENYFAVVGARQVTTYGKQVTDAFVRSLAMQGLTIVSGLALGIDGLAHQASLNVGARTIAVLGNGLDQVYPVQNRKLADKIIENGAIISEFPLGTPPHNYNFPRRNRIISGMSLGVLVTEAKLKSGSLITARNAIEQNREVFAIPGSIYSQKSEGTNYLIQKGEAKLVRNSEDVLEELNLKLVKSQNIIKSLPDTSSLDSVESEVLSFLSKEPLLFDNLQLDLEINTAQLSTVLTILEMKGFVSNLGSNQWVKTF